MGPNCSHHLSHTDSVRRRLLVTIGFEQNFGVGVRQHFFQDVPALFPSLSSARQWKRICLFGFRAYTDPLEIHCAVNSDITRFTAHGSRDLVRLCVAAPWLAAQNCLLCFCREGGTRQRYMNSLEVVSALGLKGPRLGRRRVLICRMLICRVLAMH